MSNINFECNATEFDCVPYPDNDKNVFAINQKALIINIMNGEDILIQTEIEKADAIRLAKLILLVYEEV
jgi:hypothetical protein